MSDYSFMKSGVTSASSAGTIDVDMMHKLVALVKTLMQDAVNSADQFVKACDRSMIQDKDILMALKYETHHFLLQGESLDKKFQTNLEEEKNHTYDTEEEESSDDEEEEESEDGDRVIKENEKYTMSLKSSDAKLIELHKQFMKYHNEWDDWVPDDAVSIFLKNAVDKTSSKH
jgi:hypothetical protein